MLTAAENARHVSPASARGTSELRRADLSGLERRVTHAVLSAWVLVFVELAIVLASARGTLTSVWEVQFGVLWLAPVCLVASGLLGALGGVGLLLVERSSTRAARATLTVFWAGFAYYFAWGVSGGRQLSAPGLRVGFALGVAGLVSLVAYFLSTRLAALISRQPKAVALGAALGIVLLELVNRFVLVRLYPAFHLGLSVAAVLLAPFVSVALTPRARRAAPSTRWRLPLLTAFVLVSAAFATAPAARRLAHFDNFRVLLLERAPLAGQGVRLAALIRTGEPVAADCDTPDCVAPDTHHAFQGPRLRGKDILLVTIDALRADHVGAYGYQRPTTPNLDALAKAGARFDYAYAATPHTSYSVGSLMTGKYLRPLLLQGAGEDSETWAGLLRTYGYRTAGFYPPAVFFIDPARFTAFEQSALGFEYSKVEFLEGEGRVEQVRAYLDKDHGSHPLFIWVHLFGPHEPYLKHEGFDFGSSDLDRYDSEIAYADQTLGSLVELMRQRRQDPVVIVSADHGEEFGEHGGRYHGTTVYEEQVRVPLIIAAPGRIAPRVVPEPVQTIDLLPTVLGALEIPKPPRLRGRDLGPLLASAGERTTAGKTPEPAFGEGLALAETDEQTLLARGRFRLVCARKIGACQLFDLKTDPAQTTDLSRAESARFEAMRKLLRELSASHGRYEAKGLRAEGKGWPSALSRGIAGDGDAALEIAELLEDADPMIRRKAGEVLFDLRRPETAPALRLALQRSEDREVRQWCALALTRLGQGAPLVYELVRAESLRFRRFAALALAEVNDKTGEAELVAWWLQRQDLDYSRSLELIEALASLRAKNAVWPLSQALDDVRLRPHVAKALARIGDEGARGPLLNALREERQHDNRVALARALVELEAGPELAPQLVRFLGVPDPMPGGVGFASQRGILQHVGGPEKKSLERLRRHSAIGQALRVVVPAGGNGTGVRILVRGRSTGRRPGLVRVGAPLDSLKYDTKGELIKRKNIPKIDPSRALSLSLAPDAGWVEVFGRAPDSLGLKPGASVELVVFAEREVELDALCVVPLADELPPPAPEPWNAETTGGHPASPATKRR